MSEIRLAGVGDGGAVDAAVLSRQLSGLRLPARSLGLLAETATGASCAERAAAAVAAALRGLVERLTEGATDPAAYRSLVGELCGLGPGLTPSGDDVMCALLAAGRRLASGGLLEPGAVGALAVSVGEIPAGATTPLAHRLLAAACAGRFPLPLARLAGALGDPSPGAAGLTPLVDDLAHTGAHTGADWLAAVVALARAAASGGREPAGQGRSGRFPAVRQADPAASGRPGQ